MLVPLVFVNYTLTGINLGWKPQAIGYSTICFGITELVMALIFVYHLGLGVPGIIISAAVGYIPSIIICSIVCSIAHSTISLSLNNLRALAKSIFSLNICIRMAIIRGQRKLTVVDVS